MYSDTAQSTATLENISRVSKPYCKYKHMDMSSPVACGRSCCSALGALSYSIYNSMDPDRTDHYILYYVVQTTSHLLYMCLNFDTFLM